MISLILATDKHIIAQSSKEIPKVNLDSVIVSNETIHKIVDDHYLAAEEKQVANAKPRTAIVKDEETDKWVEKEIGPAPFRPRFYDINNAWIHDEKNRGKGYGKEIYKAFIEQAIEYSKSYGGVFIGAHHCTIGSGTSDAAKRVWKSLAKEYTSSGDVIFIGL